MAFLPAGQTYWGGSASFVETITVYVRPEFAKEQVRWLPHSANFLESLFQLAVPQALEYTRQQSAELRSHLITLAQLELGGGRSDLRKLAHLANLLALVQPASYVDTHHGPLRVELRRAIQHLESNLTRAWTVHALAKVVFLSPSQLTRLFVTHVGVPPSRYLREARAVRMRHLLMHGHANVSEAARAVGWYDPSLATRAFRAIFGHPPSSVLRLSEERCVGVRSDPKGDGHG